MSDAVMWGHPSLDPNGSPIALVLCWSRDLTGDGHFSHGEAQDEGFQPYCGTGKG